MEIGKPSFQRNYIKTFSLRRNRQILFIHFVNERSQRKSTN